MLLITVLISFGIREEGFNNKQEKTTSDYNFKQLIVAMKGFYTNKYLRVLIIIALTQNIGICPMLSTF